MFKESSLIIQDFLMDLMLDKLSILSQQKV
jgi:hypothetical protein